MSFSPAQQGKFRLMVADAWASHCARNPRTMVPSDKVALDVWRRWEMMLAVEKDSTLKCNQTDDFEVLMAHFEAIIGDSIYWQTRLIRGGANRIIYNINRVATGHGVDDHYIRRIARQALQSESLPELYDLKADQLHTILLALRIHIRRRLHRDDPKLTPGPDASDEIQWAYAARQAAANPAPLPTEPEYSDDPF